MAKVRPQPISWLPWWLRGSISRWVLRSAALLVVVAGLLACIIVLSRWAQSRIHDQDRYLFPFANIIVQPPAGIDRNTFLDEVRFHAALPDGPLNILDTELPDRLRAAFAQHPWVERVEAVTIRPPRRIEVMLTYRRPVLAVPWDGTLRAVDGAGVMLPKAASTRGLPVYEGEPRAPQGPPGTPWGDPEVERAARKLGG